MHVEAVAPTAPSRAVVINVSEHTGALVFASTESRSGIEVEIHPVSEPHARTHVWVLPREAPDGVVYAAVFPSLESGDYAILARTVRSKRSSPYHRIRSRTPAGCSEPSKLSLPPSLLRRTGSQHDLDGHRRRVGLTWYVTLMVSPGFLVKKIVCSALPEVTD